jgi:uncharacterized protein (TIGR03437 family)
VGTFQTTLIAFLASGLVGFAAQLSLSVQSTGPGSSILMTADLDPGSDSVSGLQFDLQYDDSAISVVATAGMAARISSKSIYSNDLAPNKKRFMVVGLNQNPIPAGTVVNLFLNIAANASVGLHPLALSNVTGANTLGWVTSTDAASGAIAVQGNAGSRIQQSGVLNAASVVSGPVAPGEIVTLIGSGIGPSIASTPASLATSTVLGSTSVLFDGKPGPLLYAAANQINAIVPFEVQNVTQMLITSNGQVLAGFPLPVAAASPAIFTLDASGVGQGAVLNQDSTVNSPSNPAGRGTVVVLFATGAGLMSPTPADGQVTGDILAHPTLPVSVQIGGTDAEVVYAGAAPGLVAGLLQVNCTVPASVAPGDSVPVGLAVGGISSPPGVMLSIR